MLKEQAWSTYWQTNNTDSFLAGELEQRLLSNYWAVFAKQFNAGQKIIDLATGNGSVVQFLFKANSEICVKAVDYAEINPHIPTQAVGKVEFLSHINIQRLPYQDGWFDGVTSQFGFEYSDVALSSLELLRVLKRQGKFQLLIHHANSEIVSHNKQRLDELRRLNIKSDVMTSVLRFIQGQVSLQSLETVGENYMKEYQGRLSQGVTGNIFAQIERMIALVSANNHAEAKAMFDNIMMRIDAEISRLEQLCLVAKTKSDIDYLLSIFKQNNGSASAEELYTEDNLLLAWSITGVKL